MNGQADLKELDKFDSLADRWWDPEGPLRTLHDINPLRIRFIADRANLAGAKVLDVGCGGGILSESMARAGADVVGIDLAVESLGVARDHAAREGLTIDYRLESVEVVAEREPGAFDVVTCLELLEHVPDPWVVVDACARAVRPGGAVFFSTINRNPRSFLLAIVAAEYVLGLVPRGTHEYLKLIRPSELAAGARAAGLIVRELTGLHYNPLTETYALAADVDVNYLVHAEKPPSP